MNREGLEGKSFDFYKMTKKELINYANWFHEAGPQRLKELINQVHSTAGFESWESNFSPESLEILGEWLEKKVKTQPKNSEHKESTENRLLIPAPDWDITNETATIAFDVGFYISEVFLKNIPNLRWDQSFSNKRDIDYGQPVIVGFGNLAFNPPSMILTLVYGLAKGSKNAKNLKNIYEKWYELCLKKNET